MTESDVEKLYGRWLYNNWNDLFKQFYPDLKKYLYQFIIIYISQILILHIIIQTNI